MMEWIQEVLVWMSFALAVVFLLRKFWGKGKQKACGSSGCGSCG